MQTLVPSGRGAGVLRRPPGVETACRPAPGLYQTAARPQPWRTSSFHGLVATSLRNNDQGYGITYRPCRFGSSPGQSVPQLAMCGPEPPPGPPCRSVVHQASRFLELGSERASCYTLPAIEGGRTRLAPTAEVGLPAPGPLTRRSLVLLSPIRPGTRETYTGAIKIGLPSIAVQRNAMLLHAHSPEFVG